MRCSSNPLIRTIETFCWDISHIKPGQEANSFFLMQWLLFFFRVACVGVCRADVDLLVSKASVMKAIHCLQRFCSNRRVRGSSGDLLKVAMAQHALKLVTYPLLS